MAPRIALNMAYAHLMDGLDPKQRKRMEEELYGWTETNRRANEQLNMPIDEGGGEG